MSRPSYGERKRAYEETARSVKEHWQKQGKQPTDRQVRDFTNKAVDRADRRNGW